MRNITLDRKTAETDIRLTLNIDGKGESTVDTGCGFLDHMLTLFAKHGGFVIDITCKGDVNVDYHHTVEDTGIVLGAAFAKALGDKRGIRRYGNFILPMDEALILTAVDFSGRAYLGFSLDIPTEKVGDFDTELVEEFWYGFARSCEATLHFQMLAGSNSHHILEASFKAMARSLRQAVALDADYRNKIPSTKGSL